MLKRKKIIYILFAVLLVFLIYGITTRASSTMDEFDVYNMSDIVNCLNNNSSTNGIKLNIKQNIEISETIQVTTSRDVLFCGIDERKALGFTGTSGSMFLINATNSKVGFENIEMNNYSRGANIIAVENAKSFYMKECLLAGANQYGISIENCENLSENLIENTTIQNNTAGIIFKNNVQLKLKNVKVRSNRNGPGLELTGNSYVVVENDADHKIENNLIGITVKEDAKLQANSIYIEPNINNCSIEIVTNRRFETEKRVEAAPVNIDSGEILGHINLVSEHAYVWVNPSDNNNLMDLQIWCFSPRNGRKIVHCSIPEELSHIELVDNAGYETYSSGNYVCTKKNSGDIAKVYFDYDGDLLDELKLKSDGERKLLVTYESSNTNFTKYATVKVQGTSSQWKDKKNYTLKICGDNLDSTKEKINVKEFDSWGAQSKYCLKANWIDKTHARNIVTARIGANLQDKYNIMEEAPHNGTIDGFPVEIYLNGEFLGLYTWNIPKDEWLWNLDGNNPNQIAISGGDWTDQVLFKRTITDFESSGWEIEAGPEKPDQPVRKENETDEEYQARVTEYENKLAEYETTAETLKNKLNRLINFVNNATDEEFKRDINQYLNKDSTLNYVLMLYLMEGIDNTGKNMLLVTYDGGDTWYPSIYDLDTTFGTYWNGCITIPYDVIPNNVDDSKYENLDIAKTKSKLITRLIDCFPEEIASRWFELRSGMFSKTSIMNEFTTFINSIPQETYQKEAIKWESQAKPGDLNNGKLPGYGIDQIEEYLNFRLPFVDNEMGQYITYEVSYNANGGTGAPQSQTKTYGTDLVLSQTTPTKANENIDGYIVNFNANGGNLVGIEKNQLEARRTNTYSFNGWNTAQNGSGTSYEPGETYTVDEAVILFAQWRTATTTEAIILPIPTKEGYVFDGWYNSETGNTKIGDGGETWAPTSATTLYAHWIGMNYIVSYDANGGTGAPQSQTKTHGTDLVLSQTIPTRANENIEGYIVKFNANGGNLVGIENNQLEARKTNTYSFNNWNTAKKRKRNKL